MMDLTLVEALPLFMFAALAIFLFTGFPVAFVLGGLGLGFWVLAVALGLENDRSFFLVIGRIFGGVVDNLVLVAIPLFIFMGTVLEKSGIARDLLISLQTVTRRIPGGLAMSVTLLGVIMAATTGIIGASVVMMTLMALPVMAQQRYDPALASGTVAASGTLGILIPPSIMLVVMADLLSTSVGDLFMAALIPGLLLSGLYLVYIVGYAALRPSSAPKPAKEESLALSAVLIGLMKGFVPAVALIALVLGSIFGGYATPTEASGIGAFGATVLALLRGRLDWKTLTDVVDRSALTGAMLFGIFVGATAFSFVFTLLGGHDLILRLVDSIGAGPWGIMFLLMILVFLLGFFFDWIEITLIILPIFAPVIRLLDFGGHVPVPELTVTWFAILIAVNLQTSFLTPPFGFALFYLKGAAPEGFRLQDVYRGIVPFILLQLIGLGVVMVWPEVALWLPMQN